MNILLFILCILSATAANSNDFKKILFDISKDIPEVSGAVYDSHRDVLWSIGDSGEGHRNKIAMTTVGSWKTKTYFIEKAKNIDWEAIVIDRENDFLYILDVGDNKKKREFVIVYKINPNQIGNNEKINYVKKYKIKYMLQSSFNVEAGFIKNDSLYFIEKSKKKFAKVFKIDLKQSIKDTYYAIWHGTIYGPSAWITDAEVHFKTGEIYILTYLGVYKLQNFSKENQMFLSPIRIGYWGQIETLAILKNDQFILAKEKGEFFLF